jgi:hypothetical protein
MPDPNLFHPGSQAKKINGSQIMIRICIKESKNQSILTQKIVSKLSEIRSGVVNLDFLPIPDPGCRCQKAQDRGSRIRIRNTADMKKKCEKK